MTVFKFKYFVRHDACCKKTDPVPLIQDLSGICVEWDKLIGVLDLYWGASGIAWLRRLHPLKEYKKK